MRNVGIIITTIFAFILVLVDEINRGTDLGFNIIGFLLLSFVPGVVVGGGIGYIVGCFWNPFKRKITNYKKEILIPVNLRIKDVIFNNMGLTSDKDRIEMSEMLDVSDINGRIDDVLIHFAIHQNERIYTLDDYIKMVSGIMSEYVMTNYYNKYVTNSLAELNDLKAKFNIRPYFRKFKDRIGTVENDYNSEKMIPQNTTLEDGINLKNSHNSLLELIKDINREEKIYIVNEFTNENITNPLKRYSEEFTAQIDNLIDGLLNGTIDIIQKDAFDKAFELFKEKLTTENKRIDSENKTISARIQEMKRKLQTIIPDKKFSTDFFDYAKTTESKLNIEFEKLDKTLDEINNMINSASESIVHLESMISEEEKTADKISELGDLIRQTISKKESDKNNEYSRNFENKFAEMQAILNRLSDINRQSLADIQKELEKLQKNVDSVISDMDKELSEMEERFKIKENYRSELENLYNKIEEIFQPDVEIVKNSSRYIEIQERINKFTDVHYEDAESEYHKLENEISELKADIHQEILEIIEEKRIARRKQIESLSENAESILNLLPAFSGNAKIDQSLLQKITDEAGLLISDTKEFISQRA
ncbi:MAG: hypothetical protein K2I00_10265 [Ruminococcus sp.]|nr:hypothetical protein [Ruminococcus sp.]